MCVKHIGIACFFVVAHRRQAFIYDVWYRLSALRHMLGETVAQLLFSLFVFVDKRADGFFRRFYLIYICRRLSYFEFSVLDVALEDAAFRGCRTEYFFQLLFRDIALLLCFGDAVVEGVAHQTCGGEGFESQHGVALACFGAELLKGVAGGAFGT